MAEKIATFFAKEKTWDVIKLTKEPKRRLETIFTGVAESRTPTVEHFIEDVVTLETP